MCWESERDLIVNILTREAVGGEHVPRSISPSERREGQRDNFDGRILGGYNQFGRMPILGFEYTDEESTVF